MLFLILGAKLLLREIYPQVAEYFRQLTEEDLDERLPNSPSTIKWWNLVQWARQHLVEIDELDGSTRGVWKITKKGKIRIGKATGIITPPPTNKPESNLRDLVYQNKDAVSERIISELNNFSPTGFERFCLVLLEGLGYENMIVTSKSGDGGIDGYGDYRQGIVRIKSAFQAKRWKNNPVGRPEIDKFRGAIQGEYDHGLFLTTSVFSKEAREASIKKGAITILLLNGKAIAEQMINSGIGVRKEPIYILDLNEDFYKFEKDDGL